MIGLNTQKTFFWWATHPLRLRANLAYTIPSFVKVHGFNSYGGGYGTDARVHPGNSWLFDGAFELCIDHYWVFACDMLYTYANKTSFTGTQGTLANGTPAPLGSGSSYSWSLAPAVEYNWNENLGILVGAWFTVAGRNTPNFAGGIFSVNYVYTW